MRKAATRLGPSGRAATALVLAAALAAAGCGYRFARGPSALLPHGTRLAIPVVDNPTIEPGYETVLTAALRREFAAIDGVRISDVDGADAVLRAQVVSVESSATSFDREFVESERRIQVTVAARLERGDEVAWRTEEVSAAEIYYVTESNVATRDNRREALARAARVLARQLYLRVQGGWS